MGQFLPFPGPEFSDADFPGFQDVLIGRFPEIQIVGIDEVLGHRVYESGNIPVLIDILPDPGGTHILVEFIQPQMEDLSPDLLFRGLFLFLPGRSIRVPVGIFPSLPLEYDMVHRMDGIFRRLQPVSRGIFHHIGSHSQVQFLVGKDCLQFPDIFRVGDVHRQVLREGIDVLHIRHGHVHDFPAHEPGLGVFRPGEFIQGQIHCKPHIPDPPGHCFVSAAEGIEGAGVEADLPLCGEGEAAPLGFHPADVSVQMVQDRRIAVEIQFPFSIFVEEHPDLLAAVEEKEILPAIRHLPAAEHVGGQVPESIPAQFPVVMGKGPEDGVEQPELAFFVFSPRSGEPICKCLEIFQHYPHGIHRRPGQLEIGGIHVFPEGGEEFIQFLRQQLQDHPAQVFRHVFGDLQVPDFQAVEQLHRHFVALGVSHGVGDLQKCFPGRLAHGQVFADLHQVAQMHPQVHHIPRFFPVQQGVAHEMDVGHLDHPVDPTFQVF